MTSYYQTFSRKKWKHSEAFLFMNWNRSVDKVSLDNSTFFGGDSERFTAVAADADDLLCTTHDAY